MPRPEFSHKRKGVYRKQAFPMTYTGTPRGSNALGKNVVNIKIGGRTGTRKRFVKLHYKDEAEAHHAFELLQQMVPESNSMHTRGGNIYISVRDKNAAQSARNVLTMWANQTEYPKPDSISTLKVHAAGTARLLKDVGGKLPELKEVHVSSKRKSAKMVMTSAGLAMRSGKNILVVNGKEYVKVKSNVSMKKAARLSEGHFSIVVPSTKVHNRYSVFVSE